MIRTVIEVEGKDDWEHSRQLQAAMERLGFQPRKSDDDIRWDSDFWAAFNEAGLNARLLVETYRKKLAKEHSVPA